VFIVRDLLKVPELNLRTGEKDLMKGLCIRKFIFFTVEDCKRDFDVLDGIEPASIEVVQSLLFGHFHPVADLAAGYGHATELKVLGFPSQLNEKKKKKEQEKGQERGQKRKIEKRKDKDKDKEMYQPTGVRPLEEIVEHVVTED